MKIKALTSFAGKVSMYEGQVRVCEQTETIKALIRDGYVEVLKEDEDTESKKTENIEATPEEEEKPQKAGKKK
ncbi:hypothetical protein NIA71_01285 [Ihubacter massiliensis]|uniref:hypothetical protein n=1 Tax=Ihubacter massiliensis TaxID=1852367 RepID=UPI0020984D01|nr:hypothetical protein [Ihubacter massiliensis]MCI7301316.1 hypothetical protein [Clostridia bacterium]MCO7120588.1 hypothetical protein [Ihubacter massiliensis]MDY3010604.1 hypothetical protein [Clostridiales Family XIII bacterium]